MIVGVDIGGTFTDFCLSVDGRLQVHKVLSTPRDPAQAMLAGLTALGNRGFGKVSRVLHGSTVATNAILERKGARTALITTQGFRDILFIGRQDRPVLYSLHPRLPEPLIPREWCFGVPERLDHLGRVLTPLDLAALDGILDEIARRRLDAVAVCLLYSYRNPIHELAIRSRMLERGILPEGHIALSCEVLPEFREVERASTVALEAYVRPVMGGYLGRLESALGAASGLLERPGPESDIGSLRIIKSDGGVMSARRARSRAVNTVLSGPAAGAIGGFFLAQQAGYDHAITLDMGGTSTDVAICPGQLVRRAFATIDGWPLRTRLLDIETIGAGGGSLARLDVGGALHVGPESAGADPGPAVYGLGGCEPTVTDANAVLGRLDPRFFLGGAMPLHPALAQGAVAALAAQMHVSTEAAALGILHVANVNIDRALRRVSVARGYDPRLFTLVAFGGAGPLHACSVAEGIGIPRVLVPRYPGVLCAFGLLMADVVLESTRSVLSIVDANMESGLWLQLDEMIALARQELRAEGIAEERMAFHGLADARYRGQSYELTLPLASRAPGSLRAEFDRAHERAYGHAMSSREVEVVNLRLQAVGMVDKPRFEPAPCRATDGSEALLGARQVVCRTTSAADGAEGMGQVCEALLYDRVRLSPGASLAGPALLFQMDSTVYIPPDWGGRVDGYLNLVLERAQ